MILFCLYFLWALWRRWGVGGGGSDARRDPPPSPPPPVRVPFSWDMFAIKIERCAVSWQPPLLIDGKPVAKWRDRSAALEFDTVFDEASYYDDAALLGCAFRSARVTTLTVACASSDGEVRELRSLCP